MSQAAYLRDMLWDPDQAEGPSEVAEFYRGKNVLLTGGTGFLGLLLMERILRSCSEIKTLFVIVRTKKGKNPGERFKEMFDDVIFNRLKYEKPGFARKVVLIEGDMAEIGLGLSPEQRELLRCTNIVIHGAATVRFDEKLRIAANINVRGTQELLLLAKEMFDLEAFVHISTAYSNCVSNVIEEKFYQPPINSDKLLDLLHILDDTALEYLTPVLLGKWPNTYAFTKAIAEDAIQRYCQNLPLCVVRPSIIVATSMEPISGWVNNVYGATGVLVGAAAGLIRTLHCDQDLVADLIPADYVVNNVIVAAWDIAKTHKSKPDSRNSSIAPKIEEPVIYNIVSSPQRPITWGEVMDCTEKHGRGIPTIMCMWYYCFRLNKHRWLHNLSVIFLHLIPAAIADTVARLIGRKPVLWAAYKKIHKFSAVIEYFTLQEWKFDNSNVQQLWKKLSPVDRSKFDLDIEKLSWADYSYNHVRGLRLYVFKDPPDTIPKARAKLFRLKIAHYILVTVIWGIFLWLLWKCLRFAFA